MPRETELQQDNRYLPEARELLDRAAMRLTPPSRPPSGRNGEPGDTCQVRKQTDEAGAKKHVRCSPVWSRGRAALTPPQRNVLCRRFPAPLQQSRLVSFSSTALEKALPDRFTKTRIVLYHATHCSTKFAKLGTIL